MPSQWAGPEAVALPLFVLDRSVVLNCGPDMADAWFPDGGGRPSRLKVSRATARCQVCPARPACLEFALETEQPHGIWGGVAPEERRRIKEWRAKHGGHHVPGAGRPRPGRRVPAAARTER